MKFTLKLMVGVVGLGFGISTTLATPLAVEDFEKDNVGQLSGQSGGNGWTAAWYSDATGDAVIGASGLNYSSGTVTSSGGSQDLQLPYNANYANPEVPAVRYFTGPTNITTPIYYSFLLNANSVSNDEFIEIGLSNNTPGTGAEPAISVGATTNGGTGNPLFFFARSPAGTGGSIESTTPFAANQTYLVVAEVSSTNGSTYNKLDLYVDPSSGTQPAIPTLENTNDSGLSSITSFNVRTARLAAGDVYSIDNVNIGTSFSDVVSTPEPASLGLLGLGAGALLIRRRRATSHVSLT